MRDTGKRRAVEVVTIADPCVSIWRCPNGIALPASHGHSTRPNRKPHIHAVLHLNRAAEERQRRDGEIALVESETSSDPQLVSARFHVGGNTRVARHAVQ